MLQDGFHKSFAELFALIKQQNAQRDSAGPESAMWNNVQIENEPEKLEMLKEYLTKAESAARVGMYIVRIPNGVTITLTVYNQLLKFTLNPFYSCR